MSRFEDFLPEVMPYVPGCPEAVAVNAIRNAAIEFCRKSLWLLYEHDPIQTVAYEGAYELDLPTDYEMVVIYSAMCDGRPLTPAGEVDIVNIVPAEGQPRYITQIDTFNVRLFPKPVIAGLTVQMFVAIAPTRSSVTCEDSLAERWAERIGYGARARLYEIPGQPFSNPDQAFKYQKMFSTAIGEAKVERSRGLTRATMRVIPPRAI